MVPSNPFNLYVNMFQCLPCRPDLDWHECCTDSSPRPRCHSELPHGEQFPQTDEEHVIKKIGQIKKILSMYTTFTFGNCKEMIVGDILLFKVELWQTKCLFLLNFTNNLKEIFRLYP